MEHITKPFTEGGKSIALFVISLFAFAYTSVLAMAPYALQPDFLLHHGLTLTQFHFILTYFFIGYLIGLTLCGFLMDITGETLALIAGMVLAVVANLLFTYGHDYLHLLQARFIMGFSYGLISVGVLKQLNDTFTRRHFAFGLAILTILSVVITILSKNLLHDLGSGLAWYSYLNGLTVLGLGVLILTISPLFFAGRNIPSKIISFEEILGVVKQAEFWFATITVYIAWQYIYFVLNWVTVPYLMHSFHFSQSQTTTILYSALILFAISALVVGYFAEIIHRKRLFIGLGFLIMVGALYALITHSVTHVFLVGTILCIGAISAAIIPLIYARLREYCTASTVGFSFGLVLLVYMICQLLVTRFLINIFTKVAEGSAVQHMSHVAQYEDLLGLVVLILLVGTVLTIGLRAPQTLIDKSTTVTKELKAFWRGEAGAGSAFWLLYLVGTFYIGTVLMALASMIYPVILASKPLAHTLYLLVIPYQVFALICLWRCGFNTSWGKAWGYVARFVVLLGFVEVCVFVFSYVYLIFV